MQGNVYNPVFSQHGIQVVTPDVSDQNYIHAKYMGERVKGVI